MVAPDLGDGGDAIEQWHWRGRGPVAARSEDGGLTLLGRRRRPGVTTRLPPALDGSMRLDASRLDA